MPDRRIVDAARGAPTQLVRGCRMMRSTPVTMRVLQDLGHIDRDE